MDWVGSIADVIGVLSGIFALLAWLGTRKIQQDLESEKRRQNQKIKIILRHGADKIELPVGTRRAELSRGEVLGRLGMIPMQDAGKRFSIQCLNTPEFMERINLITESSGEDFLEISCTEAEMNQFRR